MKLILALMTVFMTCLAVFATYGVASATISSMEYLGSYTPSQIVKVWWGETANIVVKGTFLDLSTGIEIVNASGNPVSALTPAVTERHGGSNTRITVRVTSATTVPLGQYTVRIRYAVETSGPDQFKFRLYDLGDITSITMAGDATNVRVGQPYTFDVRGLRLDNAQIHAAAFGDTISDARVLDRGSTLVRVSVTIAKPGFFQINSRQFYDKDLPSPPAFCGIPPCYRGQGAIVVNVRINPVVTSLTPSIVQPGTVVEIRGANLKPQDHTVKLEYKTKYFGVERRFRDLAGNNSALTFSAPQNVQPDSLVLHYTKTGEQVSQVTAITQKLHVLEPPQVTGATEGLAPWTAGGQTYDTIRPGRVTLVGKHLIPPPAAQPAPGPVGLPSFSPVTQKTPIPSAQTTVTFGATPLPVQSVTYVSSFDAQGKLDGRDLLVLTVPDLPATQSATLTVTTPGGTATRPNILYVDKPAVTKVQEQTGVPGAPPFRDLPAQTLIRGKIARLIGSGLRVSIPPFPATGRTMVQQGKVKIGGTEAQVFSFSGSPPSPDETTYLDFTVPANATSGQLTVSTFGGETVVGSFQVADVTGLPVASFTLVPASVVGGGQVTGSAALTGTVPPGQSGGQLEIFGNPEVMQTVAPLSITSNPMTFTIATKPVAITRNETISARSGGISKSATLTLLPLQPAALTLSTTNVVGGNPVMGTVQMNGSVPASAGVTVALSSSDPTAATVPPTATVNGNTATFTINTAAVASARSVTISATGAGLPRSATMTVGPASLAGVSVNPAVAVATQSVGGAVTMTGPVVSARSVALTSSDPAAQVPASVTVSGTSATFQVTTSVVTTPKSATITATALGVSKTTTLTVNPLTIQSVTLSPSSIRAGGTSTGTVTLSAVPGKSLVVPLSSSNTNVATVPSQISFAPGQGSQIFAVTAKSPIAQQATVMIRANIATHFGEASLNVTP